MPKILCKCGEVIRYSEIPSTVKYHLISDVELDRFQGQIDAEELYRSTRGILECQSCKRLLVFWNGFGAEPTEYVRVTDK